MEVLLTINRSFRVATSLPGALRSESVELAWGSCMDVTCSVMIYYVGDSRETLSVFKEVVSMSIFKREGDQPPQPSLSNPRSFSTTDIVTKPSSQPEPTPPPVMAAPSPTMTTPLQPKLMVPSFSRDTAAVLDRNSRLQGTLHSQGNVLIEGSFEGEMEAKETILVQKDAQAKGQLLAENVIVSGLFDGEAVCQGQFQVTPTGSIAGEINTRILVVEEGSTVNCRFIMSRDRR